VIDPYETLGIDRGADEQAIKAAYRKVVKAAHPDSGGDTEAFRPAAGLLRPVEGPGAPQGL
jgi:curved DNA-binding protein CbpA